MVPHAVRRLVGPLLPHSVAEDASCAELSPVSYFSKVLPLLALNRVRELLSPTNRGFRAKGGFVLSALGSLGGCGFKDKPSAEAEKSRSDRIARVTVQ